MEDGKVEAGTTGKGNKCRVWTEEELALLAARYPDEGAKALARLIGRTPEAVKYRATILGIGRRGRAWWTGRELALLGRLYPTASRGEIAAALPRHKWTAIRAAAGRIDVAKFRTNYWTDGEEAVLRSLWPRAPQRNILAALPGRSWYSARYKARALGLRRERGII